MGEATGKTFEQWLEKLPNGWAFVNQDNIRVKGRNDEDTGTECIYTVPARAIVEEDGTITLREARPVPFTIPDSVHSFPDPRGNNTFRRYVLLVGGFLSKGGKIEDVTDPFHDDDDDE